MYCTCFGYFLFSYQRSDCTDADGSIYTVYIVCTGNKTHLVTDSVMESCSLVWRALVATKPHRRHTHVISRGRYKREGLLNTEQRVAFDSNRQHLQTLNCHFFLIHSKSQRSNERKTFISSSHSGLFLLLTESSCVLKPVTGGVSNNWGQINANLNFCFLFPLYSTYTLISFLSYLTYILCHMFNAVASGEIWGPGLAVVSVSMAATKPQRRAWEHLHCSLRYSLVRLCTLGLKTRGGLRGREKAAER